MNRQKSILDKVLTCKRLRGLISESSYTYEEIAEFLELNSPNMIERIDIENISKDQCNINVRYKI